MTTDPSDPPASKPARRPARALRAKGAPAPSKVKLQVTLDPATKLWIEVQALGKGCTVSAIVEDLVSQQPAGYLLSRPRTVVETPDRPALTIAREAG